MTARVLCKYHMNGTCKYGDSCAFSHDKTELPNLVCTYYLAGHCAYGDKCRYNHIKAEREKRQGYAPRPPNPSKPSAAPTPSSSSTDPPSTTTNSPLPPSTSTAVPSHPTNPWTSPSPATHTPPPKSDPADVDWDSYDPWEQQEVTNVDPADLPICSQYSATGDCPRGECCPLIHGDLCEICQKFCLHPYNPEAAQQHGIECRTRHDRLQARLRSADVECGICLERVMSKADTASRRFGLMACPHPFCLPCIRNWRATSEADPDTAVRTCPICRVTSHFVTPSSIWPSTSEEREAIIDAYKGRLGGIDCRHFDFGAGSCPFGTSCFYRHVYRDGRPEEVELRRCGNADGEVRVVGPIKLSSFLDLPSASRLLTRRR